MRQEEAKKLKKEMKKKEKEEKAKEKEKKKTPVLEEETVSLSLAMPKIDIRDQYEAEVRFHPVFALGSDLEEREREKEAAEQAKKAAKAEKAKSPRFAEAEKKREENRSELEKRKARFETGNIDRTWAKKRKESRAHRSITVSSHVFFFVYF